jgi:hypothetical protein
MSTQKTPDEMRIERLIAMAARLIEALESDIAALKSGNPRNLRTIDPEIQKLTLLYNREAAGLDPAAAKGTPLDLRRRLFESTKKFRDLLGAQTRLLTRLRGASEGMVRAVADEIERQRAPMRPYGAAQQTASRSSGAILYNSVI